MTKTEAALILDPETTRSISWQYKTSFLLQEAYNEARRMGAAALLAQVEQENQKPMTEDELYCLKIKEWVWIEVLIPFGYVQQVSAYYRKQVEEDSKEIFWCGYPGLTFGFEYADYGKKWLAYWSKPKEAMK